MKDPGNTQRILWLFRPEDSSNLETAKIVFFTGSQDKKRIAFSCIKILFWYSMALMATILLSRLH